MTTITHSNGHRFTRDEILRTINTILLTVIGIVIAAGSVWMRNMEVDRREDNKEVNLKLDGLMIATLTNSNTISTHTGKIEALEKGTSLATMDRITKTEALAAIDYLEREMKRHVEKYYQRKQK